MFGPTSRYASLPVARLTLDDGIEIAYVRRRFIPPSNRFATIGAHEVQGHERLDHITATHLGDPEQFWRICDANEAIDPLELTVTGRRIRITLPEGIPGPGRA